MTTAPRSLRVSVVVFDPEIDWLDRTFDALARSGAFAMTSGALGELSIDVIDNGTPDEAALDASIARLAARLPSATVRTLRGHGNVGYGEGHNRSIRDGREDVHLVLNPDVELDEAALARAIDYLEREQGTALVSPDVRSPTGEQQYLCRREPSVLVLLVRGFAPERIARLFARRLDRYEMRDVVGRGVAVDVPLATGCCMFVRGGMLRAVQGFSPDFFLYFEDYDLSARLSKLGAIRYVPDVVITHAGGFTASRGWRRIRLFLTSAAKYFSKHGWRFA